MLAMAKGNIAKRPDGKWRARYRDDTGKEHARHFDRRRDAQHWLDVEAGAVRCPDSKYEWGTWQRDTHQVSLIRIINAEAKPSKMIAKALGYEYVPCVASAYRMCRHCPAMERRGHDQGMISAEGMLRA